MAWFRLFSFCVVVTGVVAFVDFSVIDDLKHILATLEEDQELDDAVYKDAVCQCKTGKETLTANISAAESHITALTSNIGELGATVTKLTVEIEALTNEIAGNEESLRKASVVRAKEKNDFNETEAYMQETISALGAAIEVLSKHHAQPSFLQRPLLRMKTTKTLKEQMHRNERRLKRALTPRQQKALDYFVHVQLDQEPTYHAEYAPQSGEIYGILQQLMVEFQSDLSAAESQELQAATAYKALAASKQQEIETGSQTLGRKTDEKSQAELDKVQAEEDLNQTSLILSADQKSLEDLEQKCIMTDKMYAERKATRQQEMEAISKAIAILSNDDSLDTFHRASRAADRHSAGEVSFLQVAHSKQPAERSRAEAVLLNASGQLHSNMIASVVAQLKLDNFTEVKAVIDKMIADLRKEKQDEIDFMAECEEKTSTNENDTATKEGEKRSTEQSIEQLTASIDALAVAIDALKASIDLAHGDMLKAGEVREEENRLFQKEVADTRESVRLLQEAKQVLVEFYNSTTLLQTAETTTVASSQSERLAKPYAKHESGSQVIAVLEGLVQEGMGFESTLMSDENASQTEYETTVGDLTKAIEDDTASLLEKDKEKADKQEDLAQASADLDSVNRELSQLSSSAAAFEEECSFTMRNFDVRQEARDNEIKSLDQAKAILSGQEQ